MSKSVAVVSAGLRLRKPMLERDGGPSFLSFLPFSLILFPAFVLALVVVQRAGEAGVR